MLPLLPKLSAHVADSSGQDEFIDITHESIDVPHEIEHYFKKSYVSNVLPEGSKNCGGTVSHTERPKLFYSICNYQEGILKKPNSDNSEFKLIFEEVPLGNQTLYALNKKTCFKSG